VVFNYSKLGIYIRKMESLYNKIQEKKEKIELTLNSLLRRNPK